MCPTCGGRRKFRDTLCLKCRRPHWFWQTQQGAHRSVAARHLWWNDDLECRTRIEARGGDRWAWEWVRDSCPLIRFLVLSELDLGAPAVLSSFLVDDIARVQRRAGDEPRDFHTERLPQGGAFGGNWVDSRALEPMVRV